MTEQLLLCTDLDRTLIPNGTQPESSYARKLFSHLVNHKEITLAYVTGRDKQLVQKAIAYYQLPIPDFVIADVGASLYVVEQKENHNSQWHLDHNWESRYKQDWQGKSHKDIEQLFSSIPELRKQEIAKQKPYKLSYYVPLYLDHHDLLKRMKEQLNEADIHVELIWSVDEPDGVGLLDVMPKHATKRYAIEYLMQQNNFNLNNTLFAGDSGNDIDVLLSPIKSILVSNAHKDVKNTIMKKITEQTSPSNVYIASGSFMNMNGNYSAGVLEGVHYYIPDIHDWLEAYNEQ